MLGALKFDLYNIDADDLHDLRDLTFDQVKVKTNDAVPIIIVI
jgi:hypothetical protein